jgi:NitT/TauT family transport system permease protein
MKTRELIHLRKISAGKFWFLYGFGIFSFLLYWLAFSSGLVKPLFLPSPMSVINSVAVLFRDFGLINDIEASLYRIFLGFLFSFIIAFPLGIYLAINRKFEAFLIPIVSCIRYIPPSALIPLFILWFGVGDFQKILLIVAGIGPYLTLLIFESINNVAVEFIEVAYTLGANSKDIILKVIIPYSMPAIWSYLRLMFGAAWTFVLMAEIVAATSGLGHLIITAQRFLQTPKVFGAILIIGTLGLITDFLFSLSYKIIFPWANKLSHA